jgi:hypothetical protein
VPELDEESLPVPGLESIPELEVESNPLLDPALSVFLEPPSVGVGASGEPPSRKGQSPMPRIVEHPPVPESANALAAPTVTIESAALWGPCTARIPPLDDIAAL